MRPVFRMLYKTLGRIKITGEHHVPVGKPYVIAANHVSIFDPPFAVSFWQETPEVIGASTVFQKQGQGLLLSMYGVIPVYHGEYDRALLEKTITILKAGLPLYIAPEGGRSHVKAMQRAMPGIGYIIDQVQVPVIPVGIVGTTGDFWQRATHGERPQVEMNIGKPIQLPPNTEKGAARREMRQHNADLVMRHIAGLLPEEYHGVYAGQAIT